MVWASGLRSAACRALALWVAHRMEPWASDVTAPDHTGAVKPAARQTDVTYPPDVTSRTASSAWFCL